jgi:hypothetical protein
MVWSKIATLNSTYSYDEIFSGGSNPDSTYPSRYWNNQQWDWILNLLVNECGFTRLKHPSYQDDNPITTAGWAGTVVTHEMTDILTGLPCEFYWWWRAAGSYWTSTTGRPYYLNGYSNNYKTGAPPENPGTSTSTSNLSTWEFGFDGGDASVTGTISAYKSDLNPNALLVISGRSTQMSDKPVLYFYWPGPTEVYRTWAAARDSDPTRYWKYGTMFTPWFNQCMMSAAGNPSTSNYWSDDYPRAQILQQRFSLGETADQDDPGSVARGNVLYQDYWMIHPVTYQPLWQAPRDVLCYRSAISDGGNGPSMYTQNNTSYKGFRTGTTYSSNGRYYLSFNNYWFDMGESPPVIDGRIWDNETT